MAASITFDFVSRGGPALARDFKSAGDNAAAAAKGAKVLSNVIETLGQKENRTAAESALLAKALRQTGDAEDRAAAKALAADIAIRRLDDALKDSGKSAGSARGGFGGLVGEVTGFGAASTAASSKSSLFAKALAGINLASGVLEPALAGVVVAVGGLGAAFAAAGAGALAYSVALKPLLSQTQDVIKAQETLDKAQATAQANYAAAIKSGVSAKTADAARTKAMTKAQDAYNIAVKGTPGPVREFAKSVTGAKATYTAWADSLARPVLAPLSGMLKLVKPALTALTPLVKVAAGAFGTLVKELSAKVNAGGLTSVVSTLLPHVRTTILDLGHAAGNVAAGIWGILKAFLPVSGQMTGGVVKLTALFKRWAESLPSHSGFQSLMAMFRTQTPMALEVLKNLGTVLLNVGKAMTGISTFSNSKMLLQALLPLTGLLAELSKNPVLDRIVIYLWAAHAAASKLGPALQSVVGGIKLIGTALEFASANPIVLIAAAVIALGVAFYVAWQKSAGFRDVMKYIAQGFLGAGIIIVQVNKAIVSSFLSMVGSVLHAAATAFGWVPGLGDKLRGASRAFDGFKAGVDKTFDGVIGKMRQWQDSLDKTRSASHDAAVKMTADFARQGAAASQARTDLGKYTEAIGKNRVNSDAAKAARASLIADLHKAGVNSGTARADVAKYTEAVRANGINSDQARAARTRLNNDIATAFRNSQQGKRDINNLSEAIRQHGAKSDAARGARSRLLQDLINTGLDSRTAKTLVNNLQTAISSLKGKVVTVGVNAAASGGIKFTASGLAAKYVQLNRLGMAEGGFVRYGSGPTADDVPAMLSRGELVVPATVVQAGAVDHLRGRLPGFASGGVAGQVAKYPGAASSTLTGMSQEIFSGMVKAILNKMLAAAAAGSSVPGQGGGAARWKNQILTALAMLNQPASLLGAVEHRMNQESGGNPRAVNLWDSNAAAGYPSTGVMQVIRPTYQAYSAPGWRNLPPMAYGVSEDVLANTYAGLHYAVNAYRGRSLGSVMMQPGGYARGGLVPGYASGGTVARQGKAWLNAWKSRHGGGFGAAWGPKVLNQQIPEMAAAAGRAKALAGASGLSPAQHRFWAAAAADETKRLGVLRKELTTERSWRYQLQLGELGLDKQIRAAGNLPGLGGAVKGWKAQLARDKATIAGISKMLGYSNAYLKAHPATAPGTKPGGPPVSPVKVTHTYGGDVVNSIAPVLAAALGPFTGAARGGLVSYDRGGWLKPGATMAWNGTGRPEQVLPARGGGGRLQVEWVGGNGGDDLERWIRKNVRIRGGGDVQRAYGAR